MTDVHQSDVAATETYQATAVETLRALASRLNDIADHAETGSQDVFDAFFGQAAKATRPTAEQTIAAAREAISNSGL